VSAARLSDEANKIAMITARRVTEAVVRVVNDTPQGACADRLYAALTDHLTRDEYDLMMRLLVNTKHVSRRGGRFFPAPPSP